MQLIRKKTSSLKEHPLNPKTRRITKDAKDRLKISLEEFGTIQPVVWNKKLDCLVSGHQRVKLYKSKKQKEIDVWEVNLDEQDHALAMYALNNHYGEFDEDMLRAIIEEVKNTEELEVDAMGFEENEIKNFLKDLEIDSLPEERWCSTLILDTEQQKKEFMKLRKKFKDSSELADMAETKLKLWTA